MRKPRPERLDSISVAPWLEHLERHLPIARRGDDFEGVHQLRVAAQRLRTWLKLKGNRILDDDLRWLRTGAEEVRDLDVSMSLVEPGPYLVALQDRWREAHRELQGLLDSSRLAALLASLSVLPPVSRDAVVEKARRWLSRTRRTGDLLDWKHAPEEELHDFRRRTRRLRYALDWIGEPRAAVKKLAEDMGEVNDLAVLRDRLLRGEHFAASADLSLEAVLARLAHRRTEVATGWPALSRELRKESL